MFLPLYKQFDFIRGEFFFDGPILMKSGVTLDGGFSDEFPGWTFFITYDGPNTQLSSEEAVIVIDSVTNAEVSTIWQLILDTTPI